MIRSIKLSIILGVGLVISPCTSHAEFILLKYVNKVREAVATRISGATDEEIKQLEEIPHIGAQMEATHLRTTYSDLLEPCITFIFQENVKEYLSAPFSYIGAKTTFKTCYNWFVKKIEAKKIVPLLVKGILSGTVIFAVNEVAKNKLHPEWVKRNYYLRTLASKVGARIAVACGILLLGIAGDADGDITT